MDDLEYILGIGFSGSDLPRAVILAFLFAAFAKRDTNIWKVGLLAILIDRTVWPIAAMSSSGADLQSIYASIGAIFQGFTEDLGIYIVRYIGLVLMIGCFRWSRQAVHRIIPGGRAAAHA